MKILFVFGDPSITALRDAQFFWVVFSIGM